MSKLNRTYNPVIFSIIASIVLHLCLIGVSPVITLQGAFEQITSKMDKTFKVKTLKREVREVKFQQPKNVQPGRVLKFESPGYSDMVSPIIELDQDILKKNPAVPKKDKAGKLVKSKKTDIDYLKESKKDPKILRKKTERKTRSDLVEIDVTGDEETLTGPDDLSITEDIPETFLNKMPGFTPGSSADVSSSALAQGIVNIESNRSSVVQRKSDIADLSDSLISELTTYQDSEDGQRYYKISIRFDQNASNLPTIPKEILFLVDCSLSINRARLEEFKEGLKYSLNHLNEGDRFNIMAFKEQTQKFRPSAVEPTKENVYQALRFVEGLKAGAKTDTYTALHQSITSEKVMAPTYVLLLSDGRPTKGVTDSLKVINEISEANDGRISIFAFTGGLRVNRYLLDFISYKNRGWSEYATRSHFIGKQMSALYNKIKDPVLLNMDYNISGITSTDIFPKILPDFFKNAEFTLYGKYDDEDQFSLQLLGELDDLRHEYIIVGSLKNAAQGGADIAENWAFNKIYDLISQLAYKGNNKSIIEQINALATKYKIKTPYSESIK